MSWVSGIVVFFLIWWVVFFCTLPIGVEPIEDDGSGNEPGAPRRPHLIGKALATTVITVILFIGVYYFIDADIISFRNR